MLENLYKFSKNAWHVKLFKWIYGTDPTKTFKTMCPYFWSFVFTILFLPLILLIKLFGKGGTQFISKMESYKRDRINRLENEFYEKYNDHNKLTTKECYELVRSSCWDKYKWGLNYHNNIEDKYNEYKKILRDEKIRNTDIRIEKYNAVKESKYFTYISLFVSILVFGLFIYTIYRLVLFIPFKPIDFDKLYNIIKKISIFLLIGSCLFLFIKYIIRPIYNYLECIELPKCKLCKLGLGKYIIMPFKFIGKGLLIIGDMIYATYKQHCPMITWKDE